MAEIIVRLRGMDAETWHDLKVFCVQEKVKMAVALVRFIKEGLARNGGATKEERDG